MQPSPLQRISHTTHLQLHARGGVVATPIPWVSAEAFAFVGPGWVRFGGRIVDPAHGMNERVELHWFPFDVGGEVALAVHDRRGRGVRVWAQRPVRWQTDGMQMPYIGFDVRVGLGGRGKGRSDAAR